MLLYYSYCVFWLYPFCVILVSRSCGTPASNCTYDGVCTNSVNIGCAKREVLGVGVETCQCMGNACNAAEYNKVLFASLFASVVFYFVY